MSSNPSLHSVVLQAIGGLPGAVKEYAEGVWAGAHAMRVARRELIQESTIYSAEGVKECLHEAEHTLERLCRSFIFLPRKFDALGKIQSFSGDDRLKAAIWIASIPTTVNQQDLGDFLSLSYHKQLHPFVWKELVKRAVDYGSFHASDPKMSASYAHLITVILPAHSPVQTSTSSLRMTLRATINVHLPDIWNHLLNIPVLSPFISHSSIPSSPYYRAILAAGKFAVHHLRVTGTSSQVHTQSLLNPNLEQDWHHVEFLKLVLEYVFEQLFNSSTFAITQVNTTLRLSGRYIRLSLRKMFRGDYVGQVLKSALKLLDESQEKGEDLSETSLQSVLGECQKDSISKSESLRTIVEATFSRIMRSMVIVATREKPIERVGKGSLARQATLSSFEKEIEDAATASLILVTTSSEQDLTVSALSLYSFKFQALFPVASLIFPNLSGMANALLNVIAGNAEIADDSAPLGAWATTDWVPAMVRSSVTLDVLPSAVGVNGLVDPDANSIIDIVFLDVTVPLVNLLHPNPTSWDSVLDAIAEQLYSQGVTQEKLPRVPFSEWMRMTEEHDEDPASVPAIKLSQRVLEIGGRARFELCNGYELSSTMRAVKDAGIILDDVAGWIRCWKVWGFL
ncbi:hypothetical protein CPB85DRAFT_1432701 [Mucidula mucida]|nr:hypothetical protein CPB85DRAFT_1432701 [Mucidula mucida]